MDWWKNVNKSLNKAIHVATIERKNWKEELYNFLLNYRATPHTTTGRTPSELLFSRIIKTKVPPVIKSRVPRSLKTRDAQRKSQCKQYTDKNKSAMVNKFCVGQNVLLAKREGNKMSSVFENKLYKVIRQKGNNLLVKSENGQTFYGNVSHVRHYEHNADVSVRHHRDLKLPKRFSDFMFKVMCCLINTWICLCCVIRRKTCVFMKYKSSLSILIRIIRYC